MKDKGKSIAAGYVGCALLLVPNAVIGIAVCMLGYRWAVVALLASAVLPVVIPYCRRRPALWLYLGTVVAGLPTTGRLVWYEVMKLGYGDILPLRIGLTLVTTIMLVCSVGATVTAVVTPIYRRAGLERPSSVRTLKR